MALKKETYYAIETLSFLYKFGKNTHWTEDEIAIIVSLTEEAKKILSKLDIHCSPEDIKRAIEETKTEGINIKDRNTIKKALAQLKIHHFIDKIPRGGTQITHAGKNANLLQIVQLYERIGLTPCTQDPVNFDCARRRNDLCSSHKFYREVGNHMRRILTKIKIKNLVDKNWRLTIS